MSAAAPDSACSKEGLQAYLMQRLAPDGILLTAAHLLYLATAPARRRLGLEDETGDFSAGKSADFVYLRRARRAARLRQSWSRPTSPERILAALFTLAGAESVREVRVGGDPSRRARSMTIDDHQRRWSARSFVAALGWVFEHSPWVAERAWASRPFANAGGTASRDGRTSGERRVPEEQLALLRAHPDLGARARVSEASTAEQAGAGSISSRQANSSICIALNAAYRDKFGFPFLFAVKGSSQGTIFWKRLESALARRHRRKNFAKRSAGLPDRGFRLEDTVA